MAHVGEEFGLGAVGGLRLGLLFEIALGEPGHLLRLRLQRAARLVELRDRLQKQALRLLQLLLVLLDRGDVGADRDEAAVAGAPLVDLQPAPVGEPRLIGARALVARRDVVGVDDDLVGDDRRLAEPRQFGVGGAGARRVQRQIVQMLIFGVAEHQAIVGVPQHESFRDRLDGVAQALVGGRGDLGLAHPLGDVDGDADQPAAAVAFDDVGALVDEDPFAVGAAQPAAKRERSERRRARGFGDLLQRRVERMHERRHVLEAQEPVGARRADEVEHRGRPADAAAVEVPAPQPAAAVAQRQIEMGAALRCELGLFARPQRVEPERRRRAGEDQHHRGQQRRQHARVGAPARQHLALAGDQHHLAAALGQACAARRSSRRPAP